MKIYITENQLTKIKQNKQDIDLLSMYPHYFCDFLLKWELVDDWGEEPYDTLFDLCQDVFYAINDGEDTTSIKQEICDIILNNFDLSKLVHRYIEDYISPLKYKQDFIDRIKNKDSFTKEEWQSPRNNFLLYYNPGHPKAKQFVTYLKK